MRSPWMHASDENALKTGLNASCDVGLDFHRDTACGTQSMGQKARGAEMKPRRRGGTASAYTGEHAGGNDVALLNATHACGALVACSAKPRSRRVGAQQARQQTEKPRGGGAGRLPNLWSAGAPATALSLQLLACASNQANGGGDRVRGPARGTRLQTNARREGARPTLSRRWDVQQAPRQAWTSHRLAYERVDCPGQSMQRHSNGGRLSAQPGQARAAGRMGCCRLPEQLRPGPST